LLSLMGKCRRPKNPKRIIETEHAGKITALAYSPDGKAVVN